jgi:hypothetical protein
MNRENEALWIAVYAASFADTEGMTDAQLGEIAERRANDAVSRFGKRFADHILVRDIAPVIPPREPEVIDFHPKQKGHSGTQRHA